MKKFTFIAFVFTILFSNCKDKKGRWILYPVNEVLLQPLFNGQPQADSILSTYKVYILNENNEKIYDPGYDDSVYVELASERYDGILYNKGILLLAATYLKYDNSLGPKHGFATCYLEYPEGDIDTIKIEGEHVDNEEGSRDRCHCSFPIRNVWVNDKLCNISEEYQTQHGVFYYEHY